MRLVCLAATLLLAGCTAAPEASGVAPRPVPERIVDGVQVVGDFDAEAVRAVIALVRAETDEPILSIMVPAEVRMPFYYGETDTLPSDRAEVMTGQACDGRCGGGDTFTLVYAEGAWTLTARGLWTG